MDTFPKTAAYYGRANPHLVPAVPAAALTILDVGCGAGALGAALKDKSPGRRVYGVETHRLAAEAAGRVLDGVFAIDVETADVPLPPGAVDVIIFGDVLEHLRDPEGALRRCRPLLAPGGAVLASVPNAQHHSVVLALAAGDFQYAPEGLLDATHLRFFTRSTAQKLFLDAGYSPDLVDAVAVPAPPGVHALLAPVAAALGLTPARARFEYDAYQYVFRAAPLPEVAPGLAEPLTVVACVSDERVLRANLLASPDLGPGTPHEVILARDCPTAAAGLNAGLAKARHPVVVAAHQDVYLPRGWCHRFLAAWRGAERRFGPVGVAGVYGVAGRGDAARRAGHVVDRLRRLREPEPLPAAVDSLDELLLAVRRDAGLAFDPALGFHLYGAAVCLDARRRGLAAVAVDAPCLHNSRSEGLPPAFAASVRAFSRKWAAALPVATPCVQIGTDGAYREW